MVILIIFLFFFSCGVRFEAAGHEDGECDGQARGLLQSRALAGRPGRQVHRRLPEDRQGRVRVSQFRVALIDCRRSSRFSPTLLSGADLSRCGLPPIISFSSFSSVLTDDFAYCFEYCREPDEKFDEGFKPMIEATVAVNAALKFLLFLPGQDYILKPVE